MVAAPGHISSIPAGRVFSRQARLAQKRAISCGQKVGYIKWVMRLEKRLEILYKVLEIEEGMEPESPGGKNPWTFLQAVAICTT